MEDERLGEKDVHFTCRKEIKKITVSEEYEARRTHLHKSEKKGWQDQGHFLCSDLEKLEQEQSLDPSREAACHDSPW